MEEQDQSVQLIEEGVEVASSKQKSKKKSSKKIEKEPEIVTLSGSEKEADISVEDCNPNDLVVVDSWEAERDAEDAKHFIWDANPHMDADAPIYYQTKFTSVLREYGEKEKDEKLSNAPRNQCFNCMGDHLMSDCTKPRDQQAISKNRRNYLNKSGGGGMKQTRYHLAEDQIYAHLAPGKLSNELRKALDLADDQLPRHVYLMRNMGYPPAWLEELKSFQSGLAMFDSNDDSQNEADNPTVMYDTSKIIEYPGYNVMPAPGTLDESRHHRCPPLLDHQSKEAMIKHLEKLNKAAEASRKELALQIQASICTDSAMIVVDTEGEPDEIPLAGEIVKSTDDSPAPNKDEAMDSPTLEDLETQKKLLMDELEVSCTAFNAEPYATPEQIANVGKVKHVDLGTPILKSASPYSRIPAPDNFSQGICDVINFENLPNSTGHYLRMNSVILKIRKSLTNDIDKSENDVIISENDGINAEKNDLDE